MRNGRFLGPMLWVALLVVLPSAAPAESLTLGAGAGYKRVLEGVLTLYEKETGQRPARVYGHMGQILMQTRAEGNLCVLVGERLFLQASGLAFAGMEGLGRGILVLAYARGGRLKSAEDLKGPGIETIAMPDPKQTIYGKASMEFLQVAGLYDKCKTKIVTVGTVPQVTSYLMSGDAEAGFINITDALYTKEKLGGWVVVPKDGYTPIELVIGVVKGCEQRPEVMRLMDFMTHDSRVTTMLREAGVE